MAEIPTVTVDQVPDDAVLLDVREQDEWDAGHAPGAVHVPLGDVPARLDEIPSTDTSLAVVCRAGGRSARAVQWLVQQGYDVVTVDGGMKAWSAAGKPVVSDAGDPEII